MPDSPEARVRELDLAIPDYANPPYGGRYGSALKAFHRTGDLLELSGLTPESRDGTLLHPGSVGVEVTLEQAQEAARYTAVNALGMIRYALGSLDEVVALSRGLCFVLCPPGFEQLNEVSNAASDLFLDVFGPVAGRMGRASIGATALSRSACFELWLSLECRPRSAAD
ncbi:enamine deaminase RidA (YjgF/YER057c/UK114 family) [Promicromonospora sp. AC04]|uniref:RidA family protein n=1 Tax=Promicromonospora sp. AC04 TaxID=2135723 RepID=UPI000D36CB15|nr:RidA family protein [Promicromonospora sp. AC04]PUB24824.1 enamine deaminase RidA (YjgF/YER057c/UK114 family) [Promicromonospora sp. AC04]